MSDLLSTAEAAEMAGVAPSSVKRWADEGLLACVKTAGGHRRFARGELDRFLRVQAGGAADDPAGRWVDLMMQGTTFELQAALLGARGRLGAWFRVCDELGPAITDLGRRWRSGALSIVDEHLTSERLARALSALGQAVPSARRSPRALLACADGDEHTLGLSMAELCLLEAGWHPLWAGRRTPTEEIVRVVRGGDVQMVALSASSASRDGQALASQAARVSNACKRVDAALVLGGNGPWPDPPSFGVRLRGFEAFHELAVERRGKAVKSWRGDDLASE